MRRLAVLASLLLVLGPAGAGVALADDVPGEAVLAELPFLHPEATNRIFVDLAPEGSAKPMTLLLDTGATHSVITPRFARELGIIVRRSKDTPYRRNTILGRDLHIYVDTSASDTASKIGWEYGLLGGSFLSHYVVEIDFERRRLRFLHPRRYRVPERAGAPGEAVVRLSMPSNRPHAELEVQGHEIRALLDTGDPFSLSLLERSAEEMGLAPRTAHGLEVWGVLGPLSGVRIAEARSFALGGLTLPSLPVLVAPSSYNQGDASGAAVGYDVLSRFLVRIDYPRRRLWLRRRDDAAPTFLGMDWERGRQTGVLVARDGVDLVARYVLAGSKGEAMGVRPGDRLAGAPGVGELDEPTFAARVVAGEPVHVLRESEAGFVKLVLPPSAEPGAGDAGAHPGPPGNAGGP